MRRGVGTLDHVEGNRREVCRRQALAGGQLVCHGGDDDLVPFVHLVDVAAGHRRGEAAPDLALHPRVVGADPRMPVAAVEAARVSLVQDLHGEPARLEGRQRVQRCVVGHHGPARVAILFEVPTRVPEVARDGPRDGEAERDPRVDCCNQGRRPAAPGETRHHHVAVAQYLRGVIDGQNDGLQKKTHHRNTLCLKLLKPLVPPHSADGVALIERHLKVQGVEAETIQPIYDAIVVRVATGLAAGRLVAIVEDDQCLAWPARRLGRRGPDRGAQWRLVVRRDAGGVERKEPRRVESEIERGIDCRGERPHKLGDVRWPRAFLRTAVPKRGAQAIAEHLRVIQPAHVVWVPPGGQRSTGRAEEHIHEAGSELCEVRT
mmetsp:Transcript_149756/g.479889  ORF Transcript_149756/g.479889 Transcript_149756/m.479889 type:complete len:375 (-) Transcript_149756:119-1243(-)